MLIAEPRNNGLMEIERKHSHLCVTYIEYRRNSPWKAIRSQTANNPKRNLRDSCFGHVRHVPVQDGDSTRVQRDRRWFLLHRRANAVVIYGNVVEKIRVRLMVNSKSVFGLCIFREWNVLIRKSPFRKRRTLRYMWVCLYFGFESEWIFFSMRS